MKTNTKRLLSVMLCLALVLSMLPLAAFAWSEETVTIYFDNSSKKWSKVNAYYWNDSGNNSWPGTAMTVVEGDIWSIEVPVDAVNIIFNNGSGSQTADLKVPTDGKNMHNGISWGTYGSDDYEEVEMDTVYIDLATMGWLNVNAYIWNAGGAALNGSWPGSPMTLVEGNIYSVEVISGTAANIIFNNGSAQTDDLAFPGDGYIYNGTEFVEYATYVPSEGETELVYTLVGSMNEWKGSEDYAMTDNGDGTFSLTLDLVAGEYEIKASGNDGSWYPAGDNVVINVVSDGAVTFTLNVAEGTLVATGDCLEEVVTPDPVVGDYYVVGTHNGWVNPDADYIMTANEDGTYSLTLSVEAGAGSFKVTNGTWDDGGNWGGTGAGGNYEYNATEAGDIVVTFNPADGSITLTGDILGEKEPMTIISMHVVGDLGLTGFEWATAENQMDCAMGLYSITFTGVAAGTYNFKFAANGTWDYNWATGLEVTPGVAETVWFSPLGNSSVTVAADNSTVTITFDMTTMDLLTGEGATSTVTIEAPAVENPEDTLVLGDNAVELPAGSQDGITGTYTAAQAGTLNVAITALSTYDDYSGAWQDVPAEGIGSMFMRGQLSLAINGLEIGMATGAVTVAAGDVITVKLYSYFGIQAKATINLDLSASGSGEVEPDEPGTQGNPIVIETLPYEITVDGEHDVYYIYTAEQDGTIVVTKPAGNYVSGLPNYVQDADGNYYVTVAAGDEISINPWGDNAGTYTIAYGEMPVFEDETVYFDNSLFNWETVYAYAWDANGNPVGAEWPGAPMTLGEDGLWTIAIPGNAVYIQFNNGGTYQGLDFDFAGDMLYDGLNSVVYGIDLNTQLYVAGSFNEWTASDSYIMTNNGDGTFTLVIENLAAGTYELKVTDFGFNWFGYWGENVSVTTESFGNLTVNFNLNTQEITTSHEAVELVAPTISLQYPTLLLEDEIKMNVFFTLDQEIALENMGMLTWTAKPSVVDISTADAVIPGGTYNSQLGFYGVATEGIPAQNLGDVVYFCIYVELADGSIVYGKQVQYSPTTYAYNQLNGSADAATKALYVAILNYGAAAQTFLADTDPLINANLTAEQNALVEAFRADMVHSVAMPDAAKQGAMAANGGFSSKRPTISLDSAFAINYFFTPSAEVAGDMTFYYWNAADFAAADVLSIDNATGSAVMVNEDGVYGAAIEGIAAKDIDGALYACGVYTDAEGNTYSTGILPYSLGFYCGNTAKGEGTLADLAAAIAVYGYYASSYFA